MTDSATPALISYGFKDPVKNSKQMAACSAISGSIGSMTANQRRVKYASAENRCFQEQPGINQITKITQILEKKIQ